MTIGNRNGIYMAKGITLTGGEEYIQTAGTDTSSCSVIVRLHEPVSAGAGVLVYTHPMSPEGTYYSEASALAMVRATIGVGETAVMLEHVERPTNVFGITIANNDTISHNVDLIMYANGGN